MKARIKILTKGEGGNRRTCIASGYRPNHVFEYRPGQLMSAYVGDLNFDNPPSINPGEDREMLVRFLKVPPIKQYIHVGRRWQFYEGPKLIGEGEILKIVSGTGFPAEPGHR